MAKCGRSIDLFTRIGLLSLNISASLNAIWSEMSAIGATTLRA